MHGKFRHVFLQIVGWCIDRKHKNWLKPSSVLIRNIRIMYRMSKHIQKDLQWSTIYIGDMIEFATPAFPHLSAPPLSSPLYPSPPHFSPPHHHPPLSPPPSFQEGVSSRRAPSCCCLQAAARRSPGESHQRSTTRRSHLASTISRQRSLRTGDKRVKRHLVAVQWTNRSKSNVLTGSVILI